MDGEFQIKRLQKICRFGSYLIAILLIFLILAAIAVFIVAAFVPEIRDEVFNSGDASLNLLNEIVFFITVVITVVILTVVYQLMNAISKGRTPFTIQNVKYIKSIAVLLLILGVVVTILNLTFSLTNTAGMEYDANIEVTPMLAAIVVYCISLVFQYGVVLQEESDQTL